MVLGLPFDIHYRVGNLGEAALSTTNGSVQVRVRWPYISDWRTSRIDTGDGNTERWGVGVSYHTDESLAAFGSESLPQLHPFEGLYQWRYGPTDVMLEVLFFNEEGDSVAGHRLSRPVMVLSGIEFDPVNVSVDDMEYEVGAIADEEGLVTTEVTPIGAVDEQPAVDDEQSDEEEDLDPEIRSRAIYAAGVRTQVLNDFSSAIESLSSTAESLFALVPRGGLPISEAPAASAPTLDAVVEALNAAHNEVLDWGRVRARNSSRAPRLRRKSSSEPAAPGPGGSSSSPGTGSSDGPGSRHHFQRGTQRARAVCVCQAGRRAPDRSRPARDDQTRRRARLERSQRGGGRLRRSPTEIYCDAEGELSFSTTRCGSSRRCTGSCWTRRIAEP